MAYLIPYAQETTSSLIADYQLGCNTLNLARQMTALQKLKARANASDREALAFFNLNPNLSNAEVVIDMPDSGSPVLPQPGLGQKFLSGVLTGADWIIGTPLDTFKNALNFLKNFLESKAWLSVIFYSLAGGTAITGVYPIILKLADYFHPAKYNQYIAFGVSTLAIFVGGLTNMIGSLQASRQTAAERFNWTARLVLVIFLLVGSAASGYLAFGAGSTMVQVFTDAYPLAERIISIFFMAMNSISTYFSLEGITKYLTEEFGKIQNEIRQLSSWGIAFIVGLIICFPFLIIYSHSIAKTAGFYFDPDNTDLLSNKAYDISLAILAVINIPTQVVFAKNYPVMYEWMKSIVSGETFVLYNADGSPYKCRYSDIPKLKKAALGVILTILTALACTAAGGNGYTVGAELIGKLGGGVMAGWAAGAAIPPALVAGVTFSNSILRGLAEGSEGQPLLPHRGQGGAAMPPAPEITPKRREPPTLDSIVV